MHVNGVDGYENEQYSGHISKQLVHALQDVIGTSVKVHPEPGQLILV